MTGAVVTPNDLDYEQARKVWNADIDHRPAVLVRCATAQDAAEAIRLAQDKGLELAVRCGAHRETYGHKCERLAAIKVKYDPQNIFHADQADQRGPVGKDADDVGAAADLAVQSFLGVV
jgi:FAD/FMN-containing dehydrogenase